MRAPASIPSVALSNGVSMPQLALGTAPLAVDPGELRHNPRFVGFLPERVRRSASAALDAGIRHFDCALIYRSQSALGSALGRRFAAGTLRREDVFVSSKIFHPPTPLGTRGTTMDMDDMTIEEVEGATKDHFERCLEELGVGYVDLMLLHWPGSGGGAGADAGADDEAADAGTAATTTATTMAPIDPVRRAKRIAAWKVLESYYDRGWARAIGVSNFHEVHLEHLAEDGATIRPMVNQLETSVYIRHDNIIRYCRENDIQVVAFSPFGRGVTDVAKDPVVTSVAKKHGVDPGLVALGYLVSEGFGVTFLSSSPERIASNAEVFSLTLDDEDVERLGKLNRSTSWGLPSPYQLS
ncbi:hypothetical protein ACHAWF_014607 [Thalassiosira exigua]